MTVTLKLLTNLFLSSRIIRVRKQLIFHMNDINDLTEIKAINGLEIRPITPENVESVRDFRDEMYVQKFRMLLKNSQIGVYAWLNSKVVGHAWAKVCTHGKCRLNGYFDLSANETAIHTCNVKSELRGKNIYPAMLSALCRHLLCEVSVSRVLIDTAEDNAASLRGIAKVGFWAPKGLGVYIQVFGHLVHSSVNNHHLNGQD